jgi:hypothetical protein
MAFYLVSAVLKPDLSKELEQLPRENAFVDLQPFGKVLSHSLRLSSTVSGSWKNRGGNRIKRKSRANNGFILAVKGGSSERD